MNMEFKDLFEKVGHIIEPKMPDKGVCIQVNSRQDYPFFSDGIFYSYTSEQKENERENFKNVLEVLMLEYIRRWIKKNPNDIESGIGQIYDMQSKTDFKGAFEKIYDGGWDPAEILMSVSNAKMVMRRFGNCLGVKLVSNNSREEEHVEGTAILKTLMPSFTNTIELSIPLLGKKHKGNSIDVNMVDMIKEIRSHCPSFVWVRSESDIITDLMDNYGKCEGGALAAKYKKDKNFAPSLSLWLSHWYKEQKEKSTVQWRRGNVAEFKCGGEVCKFIDGNDLCLHFEISGFHPGSVVLSEIDPKLNFETQQGEIINAGVTLCMNLYSLVIEKW